MVCWVVWVLRTYERLCILGVGSHLEVVVTKLCLRFESFWRDDAMLVAASLNPTWPGLKRGVKSS